MNAAEQPSHTPLLAGLLLAAGAAFWAGILIAAGGGNAFGRAMIGAIAVLSLASLILLCTEEGRGTGETLVWVLLGVEAALAGLTLFSLVIFGWIPVVLTILAIGWWPRRRRQRTITAPHLLVLFVAFLAGLAWLVVPV